MSGVTSTDLPVILGLSPYKSEGELAREKLNGRQPASSLPMRVGLALEPLVRAEYESLTGRKVRRVRRLISHPEISWAATHLDFVAVGERRIVETKTTSSRRWDEGLPQDIEAQVQWQLGVTGYPLADVAALISNRELRVHTVAADARLFGDLLAVASDFNRRLAEGGPFAESLASVKALYSASDETEILADAELEEAAHEWLRLRASRDDIDAAAEAIEAAMRARTGTAARVLGSDWTLTLRRTKDIESFDYRAMAEGILAKLATEERETLLSIHRSVRPGYRPWRLARREPPS